MLKRALVVLVGSALIVGGPSFAIAKSKSSKHKKHSYALKITSRGSAISSTGNPPISGSQLVASVLDGTVGKQAYHGAGRAVVTYPQPGKLTITGTNFGPSGSVNISASGTGSLDANGNATFSGTGTIKGGTGLYKGATGTFTFTGEQPKGSNVVTQNATGTVKY